jgi:L-lactate utilization protein LutB
MTAMTDLIEKFKKEASRVGSQVVLANSTPEAVDFVIKLAAEKNVRFAVKSDSALADKLGLGETLTASGVKVTETSVVTWIRQLARGEECPIDKIADLISSATGEKVAAEPEALLKASRRALKELYVNADLGITQADYGIAETGTLVTMENEGNARLAAVLPRLHLTLLDCDRIVTDLSEMAERIKGTPGGIPGHKLPAFITYLTGRNTTADIPGALFARAQGPEAEIILLLNFQ